MKRNEIVKIILGSIAIAGGLTILITLPGLAAAFAPFVKKHKFSNKQLKKSLNGLQRKGLIGISKEGDKTIIKLTEHGEQRVLKYKFEDLKIKPQRRWDKKWRIMIFDIPEKFKLSRDTLVSKLNEIGFVRIQKSVWVCPYPCQNEIDFMTELFEVRKYVRIITATSIDKEQNLLKAFDLAK